MNVQLLFREWNSLKNDPFFLFCFAGLLLTGVASFCNFSRRDNAILQSVRAGNRAVKTHLAVELFELSFFTGMCILHRLLDFVSVWTGTNILHMNCKMG